MNIGRTKAVVWARFWRNGIWGSVLFWSLRLNAQKETEATADDEMTSFRQRIARDSLASQLESTDGTREIALQRLESTPDRRSPGVLDRFLRTQPELNDKQWLLTVRALGKMSGSPLSRQWLFRILTGVAEKLPPHRKPAASSSTSPGPLAGFARQSAALFLASEGSDASLALLGQALRRTGDAALFAKAALLAHPPRSLPPLLQSSGPPTVELITLLGELGDQRAFYPLREFVRRGAPTIQSQAALALLRLGALEVVTWAAHRRTHHGGHVDLLAAAAEILLETRHPAAGQALADLADRDLARAVSLAMRYPGETPAQLAISWAPKLDGDDQRALLSVLGRIGTARALEFLNGKLKSDAASAAADALGRTPNESGRALLMTACKRDKHQTAALRGLVVQEYLRGVTSDELDALLQKRLSSSSPADRAVGAWGLSARDSGAAARLLLHQDPFIASAAASTALVHAAQTGSSANAREFFRNAAERVHRSSQAAAPDWSAIALLTPESADLVPSSKLSKWVSGSISAQFAAARVLASRQDGISLALVKHLIQSPDVRLRSATLYGLGYRANARELFPLVASYLFEPDAQIREAALWGFGDEKGGAALRLLELASIADPSVRVRRAAQSQLTKAAVRPTWLGREAAWLSVVGDASNTTAIVFVGAGLALPIVVPPDGSVVVLGADRSNLDVRLATGPSVPLSSERAGKAK